MTPQSRPIPSLPECVENGNFTDKQRELGLEQRTLHSGTLVYSEESSFSLLLSSRMWSLGTKNILADRHVLVCLGLWPLDSLTS